MRQAPLTGKRFAGIAQASSSQNLRSHPSAPPSTGYGELKPTEGLAVELRPAVDSRPRSGSPTVACT